jgi:transmembrane sensor
MNASMRVTIAREAGAWLSRTKEDTSAECRAEFHAWLQHSPHHVAEYLLATAADVELGSVDPQRRIDLPALLAECEPPIVALKGPDSTAHAPASAHRPLKVWAFAATALLTASALLWQSGLLSAPQYRTEIGEQREVKLSDGSIVQLNTRSRIRVRFSDEFRIVELPEGEALFTVAPEPARPFVVRSGVARVQAVGTQFNVYRRLYGTRVSVLEGRVRLSSESTPLALNAGEEADIPNTGPIAPVASPDIEGRMAWRQRRLEFKSATVADIAAEFNRYNQTQIRIADAAVASRRMTGLFAADRPQMLVDFLVNEGGIRVERKREAIVLFEMN